MIHFFFYTVRVNEPLSALGQLAVLALQLSVLCATAGAETYYKQYRVRSPNVTVGAAATADYCINQCLQTLGCSAVSVCDLQVPACFLEFCANIQLVEAPGCTTIVFAPVVLQDGENIAAPIHEWMLTDSCGLTFINTGVKYAPAMTVVSQSRSFMATPNSFFGKSVSGRFFTVTAEQVQIDLSSSFSVFYWFKSMTSVQALIIANIQSSFTLFSFSRSYLNVVYNGYQANISSNLNGCEPACTFLGLNFSISVGDWHYFAFVYSCNRLVLFFDGRCVLNATTSPLANLSNSSFSLQSGDPGNVLNGQVTIYCFKVFNLALLLSDVAKVATSCIVGKITKLSPGCAPSSISNNGKNYYFYSQELTWYAAFQFCESQSQRLLKVDSTAELDYLKSHPPTTSNAYFWWTSLYETSANSYVWFSDGTVFNLSGVVWWIDHLYAPAPWCFHLTRFRNSLGDCGCSVPLAVACTCQ